ncbi:MAG TPA: hydantoinase/oxoprolinase family protein [candidate division Zixibacteria bacterium]|nr:hydantoinase/oxoprolinase family protein [candidate division Zixibacteria bacterium]
MSKISIGIDIGGTFTDIIIQDKESGEIINQFKVSTTPKNPEEAIITNLQDKLTDAQKILVQQIYHATTIATNAFLGQVNLELPKTALITTKGFRDILEIGRQRRASLYDLSFERPKPIIPRRYRFEVNERMNHNGEITKPLDENFLKNISEKIREEGINSIAITLLHSYKNAVHERKIKEYFEKNFKNLYISASYEVSPEHREFERTSTTAINAILMPLVSRYVKSLSNSFQNFGFSAPLFIMQSNGGVSKAEYIQKLPVSIIESGPSAGVVASKFIAEFFDLPRVLSFDMGGTTAKAGSIVNKTIILTSEYEVGGEVHSGRITKGSGYPARFPFIDLAEISSGGGSIAWVDSGNALRVGPISAGSDPGPACYDNGGENPTITDANLLLGRLNPLGLLNKTFKINSNLSKKSIKDKIAVKLNMSEVEAAKGIIQIANNNMSRILRIVTVERGLDPRDFILNAFGGAGPLHACALAEELEIKEVLIPHSPGLFSAMGLLYTDVKHTFVKSIRMKLNEINFNELNNEFLLLERNGNKVLLEEGFKDKSITNQRFVELRYVGQGFELLVPVSNLNLRELNNIKKISQLFDEKHMTIYGYTMENEEIEVVNIRVNSLGLIKKPEIHKIEKGKLKPAEDAIIETRDVYFFELNDFHKTPIFSREKLLANNSIEGPVIIEQYDTTTVVPKKWTALVDEYGMIRLRRM